MVKTKRNYQVINKIDIICTLSVISTSFFILQNIQYPINTNELQMKEKVFDEIYESNIQSKSLIDEIKNECTLSEVSFDMSSSFTELDKTMFTTAVVNMRSSNNIESDVICKIGFAEQVFVEGYNETCDWYKISYKGKTGYIFADNLSDESPVNLVSSTAYWNEYNRDSASGRPLIANHTLAGKVGWLGKKVELYKCNKDNSVGELIGTYTFDDTGYGAETGVGSSSILDGKTIGTIENGTCIDIYMETYEECMTYARHNVYIRFID